MYVVEILCAVAFIAFVLLLWKDARDRQHKRQLAAKDEEIALLRRQNKVIDDHNKTLRGEISVWRTQQRAWRSSTHGN
jgi:hypothetical protein